MVHITLDCICNLTLHRLYTYSATRKKNTKADVYIRSCFSAKYLILPVGF